MSTILHTIVYLILILIIINQYEQIKKFQDFSTKDFYKFKIKTLKSKDIIDIRTRIEIETYKRLLKNELT